MREKAARPARGKGLRITRLDEDLRPLVKAYSPCRLSGHENEAMRHIAARTRARMKELFGKNSCSYADIGDAAWVQKKLSPTSPRWSLSDALRIFNGLEAYVAPFSPCENRNADVNEVLSWIRRARMELLEQYYIHPEYEAIAAAIRRVLIDSGAVDSIHDPRVEDAIRPFRELLRAIRERLEVTTDDGGVLTTVHLLTDPANQKLREHRTTANDGSTMSTFEGDPNAWMEPFMIPAVPVRINPNPGAKRVQSEASHPTSVRPSPTGKPRKTKPG